MASTCRNSPLSMPSCSTATKRTEIGRMYCSTTRIRCDDRPLPALIMADACDRFREFMVEGAELNEAKLTEDIERSVMMVTALSPVIGYDQASVISHSALRS